MLFYILHYAIYYRCEYWGVGHGVACYGEGSFVHNEYENLLGESEVYICKGISDFGRIYS